MSPPEKWRFQWPDGTWIRWNPDTEAWEKEISDATGGEPRAQTLDIAPEERWVLDNVGPAGAPPTVEPGTDPEVTYTEIDDGVDGDDRDDDAEEGEERAEIAPGPRRSAARVISAERDEPKSSLRPTIVAGAGIGLAVGVVVTIMLR